MLGCCRLHNKEDGGSWMSQAERERSREQGNASGQGSWDATERVQQFGPVFYITVAISAVFVLAGVFFTEPFGAALATVVGYITDYLGWLYMLMTSFFLAFAVWLALLYKTLRRDYREERRQVQEVMAHDQNAEKQQMQEIMRRHEAGEPVGPVSEKPE